MKERKSLVMLVGAMCIFGTIGILRRYIPLPSSLIALVRGCIGSLFLLIAGLVRGQKPDLAAIGRNLPLLLLSGAAIGFNWIFLFEAYCYTTVATATLCYYLAPTLVILLSPFVLKEKLTARGAVCALVAVMGMVPVSGILEADFSGLDELKGVMYGLAAAALYASVILMNKKITGIRASDQTMVQLLSASLVLLPYVLATEDLSRCSFPPVSVVLLLTAGILHTGIAYRMYFGAMGALKAQTAALFSYIDPILAILLSALVLREPLGIPAVIGSVMILGSAIISER